MSTSDSRVGGALRSTRTLVLALVAFAVVGLVAVGLARVSVDTGISSFVPRGDASYGELQQRDEDFGGEPIVVLLRGTSRNGLLIDSEQLPRLVGLEGQLSQLPDVAVVYGPGTVLNQTAKSVRNVILQISGARDSIENTAKATGRNDGLKGKALQAYVDQALADFDRRYGALIAQAMPMGLPSLSNQKFVASVLFNNNGEPRQEWKFLAPTAKSATLLVRPRAGLDQEGTKRLVERVRETVATAGLDTAEPVVTGVPVVTSAVAAAATDEAPRLGLVALVTVGLVLFLVPWTRRKRDRLRPLVAVGLGTATTLGAFGLIDRPLSLGVVAFLPIVLGIGSDFPIYLARQTRSRIVLTAAAGAAFAFASLALSPLPFVREFGLALAIGVVATVGWALLLRPWLAADRAADVPAAAPAGTGRPVGTPVLAVLAGVAVIAAGVGWTVLPSLDVASQPTELAAGLPELDDVALAEETLGFTSEVTLVRRGDSVLTPETLNWASDVETQLLTAHGDALRPLLTLSRLLEFLGDDPTAEQVTAGSQLLPAYLLEAVVGDSGRVGAMTFGLRIDDVAEQRDLIEQISAELPEPPDGVEAEWVGLPVVAAGGLDAVSASRWTIGLGGLLVAALVVGVGLRSRRTGLMVAATALIASGWVHLSVFISGADLNPLTLAVAALVTVTACEFTVMLSERHAHGRRLGLAVTVAASAATLGYLTLIASDLAVLQSFGWVLAFGVASSCAAAWLVTTVAATLQPVTTEQAGLAEPTLRAGHDRANPADQTDLVGDPERKTVPCP